LKKLFVILLCVTMILSVTACAARPQEPLQPLPETPQEDAGAPDVEEADDMPATDLTGSPETELKLSDLIIEYPMGPLTLLAYEDELMLEEILGSPLLEETVVLENADTFTGSFRKTLVYEHTTLTLFSPRDNGERFYVYNLETTDETMATFRGVRIGDSLETVRQAYPELIRSLTGTSGVDGRYEYYFPDSAYTYLFFFIEEGAVVRIQLLHEFP
jgi:hypothetical protein